MRITINTESKFVRVVEDLKNELGQHTMKTRTHDIGPDYDLSSIQEKYPNDHVQIIEAVNIARGV